MTLLKFFPECFPSLAQLISIDYMQKLSSLYAIICSQSSTRCLQAVVHMQGTESTLVGILTINNFYHIQWQNML